MAHIQVPAGAFGILGPTAVSPESTKALRELAEVLLRGPNTLIPAEGEMIAAYVSSQNDCRFCQLSHSAAAEHLGGDHELINTMPPRKSPTNSSRCSPSPERSRKWGKHVTSADVAQARKQARRTKKSMTRF